MSLLLQFYNSRNTFSFQYFSSSLKNRWLYSIWLLALVALHTYRKTVANVMLMLSKF